MHTFGVSSLSLNLFARGDRRRASRTTDTIIRNGAKFKNIIKNLSNVENFQSGVASIRVKKFSISNLIAKVVDSFQKKAKEKGYFPLGCEGC